MISVIYSQIVQKKTYMCVYIYVCVCVYMDSLLTVNLIEGYRGVCYIIFATFL